MYSEYREQGAEDALKDLALEKTAFLGSLGRIGSRLGKFVTRRGAGSAAARATGKHTGALRRATSAAGSKIEDLAGKGVGRAFGEGAERATRKGLHKVPATALGYGTTAAGMGAAFEGGTAAYRAPEGEKLDAFLQNAGKGAKEWGAYGLIGGVGSGLVRNTARYGGLKGLAKRQVKKAPQGSLFPEMTAHDLTKQQMKQRMLPSLKQTIKGGGPLGRAGSAMNFTGRAGELATDMALPIAVLPASMMGAENSTNASEYVASPEGPGRKVVQQMSRFKGANAPLTDYELKDEFKEYAVPPGYVGAVSGSVPSGIGAGYIVKGLESAGKLPNTRAGKLISVAAPTIATAIGGLGGYATANTMFPPKKPEELQKLEQIDFNKLMRYYKKKESNKRPQE